MRLDIEGQGLSMLTRCTDAIIATIWFLICCIPVVTIGASVTAVTATMMAIRTDSYGSATKKFFSVFRSEFRQSTLAWLIMLALAGVLAVDYWFWLALPDGESLFTAILVVVSVFFTAAWICVSVYLFAGIARFVVTLKQAFRNAYLFALQNMAWTLCLICLTAVMVVLFWLFHIGMFPVYALILYIQGGILSRVFEKYQKQ